MPRRSPPSRGAPSSGAGHHRHGPASSAAVVLSPPQKLSLGQKLEIVRRSPAAYRSQAQLAQMFNKSRSVISKILRPDNVKRLRQAAATGVHPDDEARRTRGSAFPSDRKQWARTALLEYNFDKLRAGLAFTALTESQLRPVLGNIARELDAKATIKTDAEDPHASPNIVTYIFRNEFRKVAGKERRVRDSNGNLLRRSPRSPGSPATQGRGFAPVLASFVPSNDEAADLEQLLCMCEHARLMNRLSNDMLDAVRQMRHFQSAPVVDGKRPAGNALECRGEDELPGIHLPLASVGEQGQHAAIEGGVDGGGMASTPGAEELDLFSGDSEEEEKKAVEALTQMLCDDPLAYQETLRPGWSPTDSQRATGETRDSGPRRAYVPITTAAPGTLPLLPANMNPSMAVLAVAPAAAMLADARAPAVLAGAPLADMLADVRAPPTMSMQAVRPSGPHAPGVREVQPQPPRHLYRLEPVEVDIATGLARVEPGDTLVMLASPEPAVTGVQGVDASRVHVGSAGCATLA
jgi:hypothetical protein